MQPAYERVFKFRAWDLTSCQMCTVDAMFWYKDEAPLPDGLHIEGNRPDGSAMVMEPNEYILMQYTNELDRHKGDIFEGDIVIVPAGYGGDNFYKEALGVIEFGGEWIVNSTNYSQVDWQELLVIGNIYEHMSMLEDNIAEAMLKAQSESVAKIWDSEEDKVWDKAYENLRKAEQRTLESMHTIIKEK